MLIFPQIITMKIFAPLLLIFIATLSLGCSSNLGTEVKEPFSGKSYHSNAKYFRATGKGLSNRDQIARTKAVMEAHKALAQQVKTSINVVADNYLKDVQGEHVNEAIERFESLTREITSTTIGDLREIGSKKFLQDDGSYAVYVAVEIKKAAMFRFLKKKAKLDSKINPLVRTQIINMCDREIERLEAE
ncbi:MAG: hypothetical protein COA49_04670 [Bacteroidetes bacterium]|nr:MAG: hypothetical protein COA49_04670 [Bacteroidota bacterium]